MDLRQVAYAVAVVDHGGFTRAANAMHVAQPSLSQSIRKLERDLGVAIFLRIGKRVRLTSAGEAFLGPARRLLRDAEEVLAATSTFANLQTGTLDLVALPTLVVDPLAELIGRFRGHHNGVLVRLADPAGPVDLIAMVNDGRCEIGLTEQTTDLRDGLVSVSLGMQELVAILPPGSTPGPTMSVKQLAAQPLVLGPPRTSTRELVETAFAKAGLTSHVAVETIQREGVVALVLAGAGASIVPAAVAAEAAKRGVVAVRVSPRIRRPIALVHRPDDLSPAARAFLAIAAVRQGPLSRMATAVVGEKD